jgi:hypothetical protein
VTSPSDERSITQLFGDTLAQLAKLVQNEVDLARAELRQKFDLARAALKLIAAGAALAIPALVLILFAIASELRQLGMPEPLAYLCTGIGAAIIAGLLLWMGLGRLSGGTLAPTATLDELHRDRIVAKELMR